MGHEYVEMKNTSAAIEAYRFCTHFLCSADVARNRDYGVLWLTCMVV